MKRRNGPCSYQRPPWRSGSTGRLLPGVVVAELLDPDEAHWLEEKARNVRQGFMDPKQKAAFEEFLARQPPVGEQ